MRRLRVLDLFSGVGAFSLGLERTRGFATAAFCEIDAGKRRVLARHWPEVHCFDDIRLLSPERVQQVAGAVDVITAGFPCQDVSSAGTRLGLDGPRSGLWTECARLIGGVRPRFVFLENSSELLSRGIDRVLWDLASLGYDAEWHCIPASYVGAPQRRDRVYIVAVSQAFGWGSRWPGRLAHHLARLPEPTCWQGDPIAVFEKRHAQPALLGMDDAPADRLDRIGWCGDAIVPDIPEMLGHAVIASFQIAEEAA